MKLLTPSLEHKHLLNITSNCYLLFISFHKYFDGGMISTISFGIQ